MTIVFNLAVAQPLLAASLPFFSPSSKSFTVGQKVVWHYKARTNSDTFRVFAEVVKLGAQRVQIRIEKGQDEFITRWVAKDKLEVVTIF